MFENFFVGKIDWFMRKREFATHYITAQLVVLVKRSALKQDVTVVNANGENLSG
jgi:hypothetical protein